MVDTSAHTLERLTIDEGLALIERLVKERGQIHPIDAWIDYGQFLKKMTTGRFARYQHGRYESKVQEGRVGVRHDTHTRTFPK